MSTWALHEYDHHNNQTLWLKQVVQDNSKIYTNENNYYIHIKPCTIYIILYTLLL